MIRGRIEGMEVMVWQLTKTRDSSLYIGYTEDGQP